MSSVLNSNQTATRQLLDLMTAVKAVLESRNTNFAASEAAFAQLQQQYVKSIVFSKTQQQAIPALLRTNTVKFEDSLSIGLGEMNG